MESSSSAGKEIPALDLIFGFDDANFSDRTLLLKIIESGPHVDDKSSNNSKKRRRLSDVSAAEEVSFINLVKYKDEVLNLSLVGIQAVLSSDNLIVTSESDVYDLVLEWAKKHYPDVEERREIMKTHNLLNLVRFPFMTTKKLIEELQTCVDIDPEFTSKTVFRAICFKAGSPQHQKIVEEGNRQFVKRAYIHRPIKVVTIELPRHEHCLVFFDLTRKELKNMFPEGRIRSEVFHLGGLELYLFVGCSIGAGGHRYFSLSLNTKGSTKNTVKYDIKLQKKNSKWFETWFKGSHTTHGSKYGIKWQDFIDDDSDYFINDIFHLRVELTLKYDHLDNIVP